MRRSTKRAYWLARRLIGTFLPTKVLIVQDECWCGTHHLGEYWHDPTHGQIDRDIQDKVSARYGNDLSLAQRAAIESTLQGRRDRGLSI